MNILAMAVTVLALATMANGQVIYQPVTYVHGQSQRFYYGGNDSARVERVARVARVQRQRDGLGVTANLTFASGNVHTHRQVVSGPPRIYSDLYPYVPAWTLGYTVDDVRNEAYANAPRYFTKAGLLLAARVDADGCRVVPAQAP